MALALRGVKRHTSRMKSKAIIGIVAYPSPSMMASNDHSKPPKLSTPLIEQMKLPARAIAPYMPSFRKTTYNCQNIIQIPLFVTICGDISR